MMDLVSSYDSIEKLLETTGWSCDELLLKLQQYKERKKNENCSKHNETYSQVEKRDILSDKNDNSLGMLKCNENQIKNDEISCAVINNDSNKVDTSKCLKRLNGISGNNECVNINIAEDEEENKSILSDQENLDHSYVKNVFSIEKELHSSGAEPEETDTDNVFNIQNNLKLLEETVISENSESTIITSCTSIIEEVVNLEDSEFIEMPVDKIIKFEDFKIDKEIENEKMNSSGIIDIQIDVNTKDENQSNCSLSDEIKSDENVRNYLKMQLNSLRTKKKIDKYLPELQKKRAEISFTNLKKKPYFKPSENSNYASKDGALVMLSEETQFVITDVSAGVEQISVPNDSSKHHLKTGKLKIVEKLIQANDPNSIIPPPVIQEDKEDIEVDLTRKNNCKIFVKGIHEINSSDDSSVFECSPSLKTLKSDSNETQPKRNVDKSPFVSDSLEDFLNESSKLKISYAVPKLGAEEGLKENEKTNTLFEILTKIPKSERRRQNKIYNERGKIYKAKTLAEKRRLMEQKPKNNEVLRNGYILYNYKKLWVPTKTQFKCITKIFPNKWKNRYKYSELKNTSTSISSSSSSEKKKPSLLQYCTKSTMNVQKYKPGPLCKKRYLFDGWVTEVKKMPKVYLEVVPEIGKPIDTTITHLLPFSNVITAERVDFALSVLKTKDIKEESKPFIFPILYNNNQEQIIVRRPKTQATDLYPEGTDLIEDVSNIINDLIRYVEIKEIAEQLIKQDERIETDCDNIEPKLGKKIRKHKRKMDLELLRLNCKVITVDTDDFNDNKKCVKPYCKMGCICKSISCENFVSNHCRKLECMFTCSCAPESNDNSLSLHTLTQLDDQVKRNLAKVEREFTQTIIHAGNDTLFVGCGGRNKIRRACKFPKKYTDFVDDFDKISDDSETNDTKKIEIKDCSISIEKLNLEDMIPFCLFHSIHNCPCKGGSAVRPPTPKKNKANETSLIAVKVENEKEKQSDSCARMRQVFSEYRIRNKNPVYRSRMLRIFSCIQIQNTNNTDDIVEVDCRENNLAQTEDNLKKNSKRKQSFEVRQDVDNKGTQTYALQRRKKFKPNRTKSIYEPVFEGEVKVSLSENVEFSKIIGEDHLTTDFLRLLPWKLLIKNYYDGKVNIWCQEKQESIVLLDKIDKIPPKNFIDIRNSKMNNEIIRWILTNTLPPDKPEDRVHIILKPTKSSSYLLSGVCLKNDRPKDDVNIPSTSTTNITDIPRAKSLCIKPNVSFKCSHKDANNEIKALIITNKQFPTRTLLDRSSKYNINLPLPKVANSCTWWMIYLNSDFTYLRFIDSQYSIKYTDLMDVVIISGNIGRTITLRNREFCDHYKHPIFGIFCVPDYQDRLFIGPYLNSEEHKTETVRYMHGKLVDSVIFNSMRGKVCYKQSTWIVEKDEEINTIIDVSGDDNLPSISRKLSIRPLKFDKKFEKINIFSPIMFNAHRKHTLDVVDVVAKQTNPLEIKEVNAEDKTDINLTKDHEVIIEPIKNVDEKSNISPKNRVIMKKTFKNNDTVLISKPNLKTEPSSSFFHYDMAKENLLCSPFVFEIKKLASIKSFNRYVVSNIPQIGYFGAYQDESMSIIDVYWPEGDKTYRFPNAYFAAESISQYLNLIYCPLSPEYTIKISVKTEIPSNTKQIEDKHLNRHYLCGPFGICETIHSGDIRMKYNINDEKMHDLVQRHFSNNIEKIVRLFGLFLMTDEQSKKHKTCKDILNWAVEEIGQIRELERRQQEATVVLRKKLDQLNTKIRLLKAKLENSNEKVDEIIEIESSDDENTTSNKKVMPFAPINKERSLLKLKVFPTPGQSLLKVREPTGVQKVILKTDKKLVHLDKKGKILLLHARRSTT